MSYFSYLMKKKIFFFCMGHVFAYRSSITKSAVLKIMAHSFTRRLSKVILVLLACLCNKVLN